jgi:hypothetical protein
VERQIQSEKLFAKCPLCRPEKSFQKLSWTAKIVDYVEWIYGLHGILVHLGGTVTLKRLFDVFNEIFGMEVKDYYLYFTSIKNRKKGDRTPLLDLEKQLITSKMEESDRKPAKK